MNVKYNIITIVLTVCLMAFPTFASDSTRSLADIMKPIPVDNAAQADAISAEIIDRGESMILELCGMLEPPGTGGDSDCRYALGELAKYASRPNAGRDRKVVQHAFLKALGAASDRENAAFFITQLQLIGDKNAVESLSQFLYIGSLCNPAVLALAAIGGPDAERELLAALPYTQGNDRIGVIHALGDLRCKKAVDSLLEYTTDANREIRLAALYALANIGGRSAQEALKKAAATDSSYERIKATAYYLLYAKRLAETGGKKICDSICRELIGSRTEPNARSAALSVLTGSAGRRALNDLLGAADDPDREFRAVALKLADKIQGRSSTRKWIAKIDEIPNEIGAEIIEMLGLRGDQTALPFLLDTLNGDSIELCLAAIPAVARLGGDKALDPLMNRLIVAKDNNVIVKLKETLLWLQTERLVEASVQALDKTANQSRAALVDILAERQASECLEKIFALTGDPSEAVRVSALRALGLLGSVADRARVVTLLLKVESNAERQAVRKSVTVLTQKIDDPDTQFGALLEAMNDASDEKKSDLLQVINDIGGEPAVMAMAKCLDDVSIGEQAANNIIDRVCPRNRRDRGLTSPGVLEALQRAFYITSDEPAREKAKAHLDANAKSLEEGFVTLFNGKDLTGWAGDVKGYIAEDGVMVCKPGGNVYTEKEYGNFVFRFEFKLPPGGNNGVGIRAPLSGDSAYAGMEIQILDHDHPMYKDIKPWQAHGSVYGIIPAKRGYLKPTGQWNYEEIIANGRHVTVNLNGTTIVDGDLDRAGTPKTMDGHDHPGLKRDTGHIGFLGHGSKVEFRNIRVKELN